MNIYVGNLSYDCSQEDLQAVFAPYGQVLSVKIIKDEVTGQSKGFGFVEMPDKAQAEAALLGVFNVKGKRVTISEARSSSGGPGRPSSSYRGKNPRF